MRFLKAAAVAAAGLTVLLASPGAGVQPLSVGTVPASFTPWLLSTTPNQSVQQLVQCGDTMYAVGTISAIGQGVTTYSRSNAFSFSATTGAVSDWAPQVNGQVHSIALSPDCSTAYIGGTFTAVNGIAVRDIAALDTSTGAVKTDFASQAYGPVDTMQYVHDQVLVGGAFTSINGQPRSALASLDPTTGAVTAYADLTFTGSYPNTTTRVFNAQLSHSGARLLIEGVFTQIGGHNRQQVAVLDVTDTALTLDKWNAYEFKRQCKPDRAFYAHAAAWSPDDNTIYVATTGWKPRRGVGHSNSQPRGGLCDAAISFPATPKLVRHTWLNYTGCDSLYSVVADETEIYVGGHQRWLDNPRGCDIAGPGSVSRPGIGAVDALTGMATSWNPTRSRGDGATDLLLTSQGLWIASDNYSDGQAQMCGGVSDKGGICLLPY